MTRNEAFQKMIEGHKITHQYFADKLNIPVEQLKIKK